MAIVERIGISAVSAAVSAATTELLRHLGYIFRFNRIVRELNLKNRELKLRYDLVQHDVDQAERDADTVEEEVRTWLEEVESITVEAQILEEEIVQKKSRFNGLCPNLLSRYRLGKRATKKTATMTKLFEKAHFSRVSYRPVNSLPGIEYFEETDGFFLSESTRDAFSQIIEVLKDDKTKMIALWGMGGVGKTTLAVELGKKAKELKLVDEVVMGVVSQKPNIETIQGQIADMLGLRLQGSSSVGNAKQLSLRLKRSDKRILIILDDLWAKVKLAEVGIPNDDDCNHLKIVITTRHLQVCNSMESACNITLDTFTEVEAWSLFKRKAGVSDDSSALMINVAKSVANECKGLPLAIITVASTLKAKTVEDWEVALALLKGSRFVNTPNTIDGDIYRCLKLSYEYLQSEEYRLCFLLCALFPEDHEIEIEVLVRSMRGLGCCEGVADSIDEVRKQVNVMVRELKASNLLLSGQGIDGESSVRMHDIVRDVAMWIASEEDSNTFLGKAGMGLKEWPSPRRVRYKNLVAASFIKNEINKHPDSLLCSRLKLLYLDENGCYDFPPDFFVGMGSLQVLSVSGKRADYGFHEELIRSLSLPESIKKLKNLQSLELKYLKLNNISALRELKGLEILSLRGSYIEDLSDAIGELTALRVLDLTSCHKLRKIPSNLIRKLSKLEELYMHCCTEWTTNDDGVLCELMELPRLSILRLEIRNPEDLPSNFYFPNTLVKFDIEVGQIGYPSYDYCVYPTSNSLKLRKMGASKLNVFKELMPKVKFLECQHISEDMWNIFPLVDQTGLDELNKLILYSCEHMECLVDTTHGWTPLGIFSNLAILVLSLLPELTSLFMGSTEAISLVYLKQLRIERCPKLKHLFSVSVAQSLVHLQILTIVDCSELKHIILPSEDVGEDIQSIIVDEACISFFPELKELLFSRLPSLTFSQGHRISVTCLEAVYADLCCTTETHFLDNLSNAKKLLILDTPNMVWSSLNATFVEQLEFYSARSVDQQILSQEVRNERGKVARKLALKG